MESATNTPRYLFRRNVHAGISHRVKDREKSNVFYSIATEPVVTRKSIVRERNMRPTTVSSVVNELIRDRLVVEGDTTSPGRKGRPETRLHPLFGRLGAVAVFVVSRQIHAVLVDIGQTVLAHRSVEVHKDSTSDHVLTEIRNLILSVLQDPCRHDIEVLGIGLSLPGNLDVRHGVWLKSTRWTGLYSLSLKRLETEIGMPVHYIKNLDAECVYILRRYPELSRGGTLLIHWGYGIGASYADRGTVLHANAGLFGEIGHWCVDPAGGSRCVCGDVGCLETRAALWALLPGIRSRFPEAPELEDEFGRFLARAPMRELPGLPVAIEYMATALRNLYQLFYPDNIVLYGPFTERREIFTALSRAFHENIVQFNRRDTSLRAYKMKSEGEIFGCTSELFRHSLRRFLSADWS
ncbi:MAG: ROK family protein [Spirochaetaceae bacterium]|nr:MAG: ROK family protein [Spirochaetaceae bacterium]